GLWLLARPKRRDTNERVDSVFHSWPWGWCSLRASPSEEPGATDHCATWPIGNGARRAVRNTASHEEGRRSARGVRVPCRRALRYGASIYNPIAGTEIVSSD